jgi:hypothetical protein
MAATGFTPIQLYFSTTASAAPSAGNLANGELAINITDGKLYYKDNGGVVRVLAGSGGSGVVAGSNTQVQFNNNGVFGASANMVFNGTRLTVADLADSGLTSGRVVYASTGGALVDSANLTFDGTTLTSAFSGPHNGTVGASTPNTGAFTTLTTSSTVTLNGGTANGVAYLNGSKVLTSGSALTFDGTTLVNGVGATWTIGAFRSSGSGVVGIFGANQFASSVVGIGSDSNHPLTFNVNSTEQMRLTSTGLGIGTSSLSYTASGRGNVNIAGSAGAILGFQVGGTAKGYVFHDSTLLQLWNETGGIILGTAGATRATLDSSGNLGLGVTPSAWDGGIAALEQKNGSVLASAGPTMNYSANAYFGSGSWRYTTTAAASYFAQISGSYRWYTAPSGTAGNAITFSQVMTLDASGNLGVGVTSPSYKLQVQFPSSGIGAAFRYLGGTNNPGLFFSTNESTTVSQIDASGSTSGILALATSGTERARIDSSGNLLVQATSSSVTSGVGHKIRPDAAAPFMGTVGSSTSGGDVTYSLYSTGSSSYRFYVGYNGTISAVSTTISAISDQRLKENVQDLDVGLDAVMALKPRKFDWKEGKGKNIKGDRGWIAQEFEQVFPDMIDEWRDEAPEGEEPYKSVRADLIPVLVKAIQELKAEFDAYKASHP